MALPGIYGRKTEKEKFAGAVFSEKIHYIIPNGRVIEGPCFHHDGQNFAKAYNIKFLNKKEKKNMPGRIHMQFQQECSEQCLLFIAIIKG